MSGEDEGGCEGEGFLVGIKTEKKKRDIMQTYNTDDGKTRRDKTGQDKTRQDKARQGKTGQDKTRRDETGQGRTRHKKTKTRQD